MIATKEQSKQNEQHEQLAAYFASFSRLQNRRAVQEPSWLARIRTSAMERFGELGFPTTKHEEWKYTSVAPIARSSFRLLSGEASDGRRVSQSALAQRIGYVPSPGLVFVNGRYAEQLSSPGDLPAGVRMRSLAAVLAGDPASLEPHLAHYAAYDQNPFVALNTAFMEDGALVEVPDRAVMEKPIHLVFVTTAAADGQPTVCHPRTLILVGRGSQASLVEHYLCLDGGAPQAGPAYWTNAVTEVVVGEGAVVDYTKLQEEREDACHVSTQQVFQQRSSSVTTHILAYGSALDREDTRTVLNGEGAEALLHGLYVIGGRQHVDNHTAIDHAQPHCASRELYKGILDGQAVGVFNGKIIVRPGAQKTDSKQSNKNLLLSEDAVINTKPQLEIYADDVKCTHGATIGQIDADALFYLRSRGIGLEEARTMLTEAFAQDVIDRIRYQPLREHLREVLRQRLARVRKAPAGAPSTGRVSELAEVG
jgi:Fe-S cluster assembly protein SufD